MQQNMTERKARKLLLFAVSVTVAKAYFLRILLKTKKSYYTTKSDSEQGDSHHPSLVSRRSRYAKLCDVLNACEPLHLNLRFTKTSPDTMSGIELTPLSNTILFNMLGLRSCHLLRLLGNFRKPNVMRVN